MNSAVLLLPPLGEGRDGGWLSGSSLPPCFTRSARWVSNYANVPRFGLRPNLLLDFATLDTQRTPLDVRVVRVVQVVVGAISRLMDSTVFGARKRDLT